MKANTEPIKEIADFFENKLWLTDTEHFPFFKKYSYSLLRCIVFTFKRYIKDNSAIKASALTYYTLMSIVPLLALVLGIARGFGLGVLLETELRDNPLVMGSSVEKVFEFARNMIENAKGGLFTGLGLAVLLYAVIKGLGNIENSFNSIWGVRKQRSVGRQFTDYMSVMMILPVFFLSLSGLNVFLLSSMRDLGTEYRILGTISPYIIKLMQLLPYFVVWIFFVFLYVFIPNTKVQFRAALISGIFIGTLVQLLLWGYIEFQIGVTNYNAVYGSFAAIPLLLIWLQMTWSIILIGAQLCYYLQNVHGIEGAFEESVLSNKSKRLLAVTILYRITNLFKDGKDAESIHDISESINVKYSHVNKGINILLECDLIIEVATDEEIVYVPAEDISRMNIAYVLDRIDSYGLLINYDIKGVSLDFSQAWEKKYNFMLSQEMKNVLIMDLNKFV